MTLSEVKAQLAALEEVKFALPDGSTIAPHFHVTEVGLVEKKFIDCGGTLRQERKINFQLFTAQDYDHRLSSAKLSKILDLSEKTLGLEDLEIEVEYQGPTIGKYALGFANGQFLLQATQTACLASDQCGIPKDKPSIRIMASGELQGAQCASGGGCC
jgi:hypothetical protein